MSTPGIAEPFLDDTSWGSHMSALISCVCSTDGPVLEVGAGYYSTLILHAICVTQGRPLVTVEGDFGFLQVFKDYFRDSHVLIHDQGYINLEATISGRYWSVVFLDEAPGARRGESLGLIAKHPEMAGYVVIHDWIEEIKAACEPYLGAFPHQYVSPRYNPPTAVLSAISPIPEGAIL